MLRYQLSFLKFFILLFLSKPPIRIEFLKKAPNLYIKEGNFLVFLKAPGKFEEADDETMNGKRNN